MYVDAVMVAVPLVPCGRPEDPLDTIGPGAVGIPVPTGVVIGLGTVEIPVP